MEIIIRPAKELDEEKILAYIKEFSLDGEDILYGQFLVAEVCEQLVGFGRVKQYGDIYEIASVGVLEEFRRKGVGKKLVECLLNKIESEEIWITTKAPDFFEKLGFKEDRNYPDEIFLKCQRVCKNSKHIFENACYMCYRKKA